VTHRAEPNTALVPPAGIEPATHGLGNDVGCADAPIAPHPRSGRQSAILMSKSESRCPPGGAVLNVWIPRRNVSAWVS
jgi:hypothetical protein